MINVFTYLRLSQIFTSIINAGDGKYLAEIASDKKTIISRSDEERVVDKLDRVSYITKVLHYCK